MSSFDVCKCGDYRHQHEGGTGRCKLGELCFPGQCQKFRLFRATDTHPEGRDRETGLGS
jgi:hypothetical protein